MRINRIVHFTVVLLFCLTPVLSQERASRFLNLYEFHTAPGQSMVWENFVKKLAEAAEKNNATQNWMAFQVALGGDADTYYIALPFEKWGDMDAWKQVPQMLTEAYGQEEAMKLLQSVAPAATFKLETYGLLEDFSTHYDAAKYASKFYRIIRTEVKPSMDSTYRSLLSRGSTVEKGNSEAPMTIRRANVLGQSFRYMASTPFSDWSDLDSMENLGNLINESMGDVVADDFFETLRKCISKREMFVLMLRPDLSRMPSR